MLKYYVMATCIVLSVAVFATAWNNRELIRIIIAPTSVPAPPKPQSSDTDSKRVDAAFNGDLPWALSALPNCVIQASETDGTIAYVRAHLPANATAISAGTTLHYGPCTISVMDDEALVTRGTDHMHIPPLASFYQAGTTLYLLRTYGTRAQMRAYTTP